jgi:hypothetical protein
LLLQKKCLVRPNSKERDDKNENDENDGTSEQMTKRRMHPRMRR